MHKDESFRLTKCAYNHWTGKLDVEGIGKISYVHLANKVSFTYAKSCAGLAESLLRE